MVENHGSRIRSMSSTFPGSLRTFKPLANDRCLDLGLLHHFHNCSKNLDDKVEEQKEISKEIGNEQGEIRDQNRLQGFACTGVQFLCESVGTQTGRMPDFMQDISKTLNKCGYFLEFKSLKTFMPPSTLPGDTPNKACLSMKQYRARDGPTYVKG
ncbi:hypothetical protein QJS10_CPB12g01775 [Acorus calamus]|uniref:Uncharacterized protein n=1 Tax=Acorus calamus TaxID=4465 RepID=A0AAV9DNZ0_ACOCL|nr:hypothetical protein QJS10_CPB12g01775 [Acorus calamus]